MPWKFWFSSFQIKWIFQIHTYNDLIQNMPWKPFFLLFCINWCIVKRCFFSISLSTVSEKWAHVPCSLRYFGNVPLFPKTPGRPSSLSIHHFHHFRLPRNFGNNYEFYGRRQRQISSIFSFGSYTEKVHKILFGEVQIVRCIETNFLWNSVREKLYSFIYEYVSKQGRHFVRNQDVSFSV